MKSKRETPPPRGHTNYGADVMFVDPTDCGSTVGYSFSKSDDSWWGGKIVISDCNRKVEWSVDCGPEGIEKIDVAIEALRQARRCAVVWYNAYLDEYNSPEKKAAREAKIKRDAARALRANKDDDQ